MANTVLETAAEPIRPRTAILWGQVDVLVQAVAQFLETSMIWDVIRLPAEDDVENLIRETKRITPDVVILCQDLADDDSSLWLRLIQEQACLKVVIVGLESNLVQVYSTGKFILQRGADLLSIMETGNFSKRTL